MLSFGQHDKSYSHFFNEKIVRDSKCKELNGEEGAKPDKETEFLISSLVLY